MKIKIKKINIQKLSLIAFSIFLVYFALSNTVTVKAVIETDIGTCKWACDWYTPMSLGDFRKNITAKECTDICETPSLSGCTEDLIQKGKGLFTQQYCEFKPNKSFSPKGGSPEPDTCDFGLSNFYSPAAWIKCLLLYILQAIYWLFQTASALLRWVSQPKSVNLVINNIVIYEMWKYVRDALNISFILFLLFSAFATVFQVDKYNYKKILLNLIIMALLVNFSYPITRFIIDLSNVLMFYLTDELGLTDNIASDLANDANLDQILHPIGGVDAHSVRALLIAVIFGFVFVVSLFTIAIMLVIRIIALAILVIFSSLAFIGRAIPMLSSYANDWWKQLFNYAFFGPIMFFFLIVATKMMKSLSASDFGGIQQISIMDSANPDSLAVMATFFIPIIILWIGLGTAQKMSIAGASAIVGKAKGIMNSAGKKFSGYNMMNKNYTDFMKVRADRKEKARWKIGEKVGKGVNNVQDAVHGYTYITPGSKAARKRLVERGKEDRRKKVNEKAKETEESGTSIGTVANNINVSNVFNSSGAIQKDKITEANAANSKAFLNLSNDDKKDFIKNDQRAGGADKFKHLFAGAPTAVAEARTRIKTGPVTDEDLKTVAAYANERMRLIASTYING